MLATMEVRKLLLTLNLSNTDMMLLAGGYVCLGHFLTGWLAGLGDKGYA